MNEVEEILLELMEKHGGSQSTVSLFCAEYILMICVLVTIALFVMLVLYFRCKSKRKRETSERDGGTETVV